MASTALSTAACPSQLCSGKNGIFAPSQALLCKPAKGLGLGKEKRMKIVCQATSISADRVPDMGKRQLMNLLLLGAISLPSAGMLIPYTYFFVPPGGAGAGGGTVAKDALGNDVVADQWLKTHGPGDRTLTQGLKKGLSSDICHIARVFGDFNTWEILLILLLSLTELLQPTVSMVSAPTLVALSHGIRLRTSSSAPVMDRSITSKARLSEDQLLCHWHWLMRT